MMTQVEKKENRIKDLPRNVWAVSITSFFMDISSEMVINILPLFLSNVLGVKTNIIGLIKEVAEATASILNVYSGWLSDKLKSRKWLTLFGYSIFTLAKPFFVIANTWGTIASVRWADRMGKGLRTAPRDALVADSIEEDQRGLAFGFHRAADTGGAMLGLLIAMLLVWLAQKQQVGLSAGTFRKVVLISLVPAVLAVVSLAIGAKEVPILGERELPRFAFKALGKKFMIFLVIVGLFDLGNSSDAFLVLRAQERGLSVLAILGVLAVFNLMYTLFSAPAGSLSDKIGRRKVIIGGWIIYALIYLGFAFVETEVQVWTLYILYGVYYGLAYGTAQAMVADLVTTERRGTAYGTYNGLMGLLDLLASLIAGVSWQGIGSWEGFGPSAPFLFGAVTAFLASLLMIFWMPITGAAGEAA
jgi:MFS family permease